MAQAKGHLTLEEIYEGLRPVQPGIGRATVFRTVKLLEEIGLAARVTFADGADVLPVFSADGKYMIWTAQRGPRAEGDAKPSSQLWIAEWNGVRFAPPK